MARGKYLEWLEDDNLIKIEAWARDGLTDEQIAKNMGVAYSTLRVWRDKYPPISAALKKGKEVVDIEVENQLLKRALGYDYDEVKTVQKMVDGKKYLEKTTITRHVMPDITAQIFWLKNRKPDVWLDRKAKEVDLNLIEGVKIIDDIG
ncbi:transposase [Finegoldia magna]|uniref:Transposase n=1 Tax=Finegoldia magna TaxID=1260 RepID=A0A233V9S0_FINMA|nr:transposase [Finegoldia magna]OXZ29141.1 transposase [Finegoldia magna]